MHHQVSTHILVYKERQSKSKMRCQVHREAHVLIGSVVHDPAQLYENMTSRLHTLCLCIYEDPTLVRFEIPNL